MKSITENKIRIGYLVLIAFIAALGGFLFGFDTAVISGTITFVKAKFVLDTVAEGWFVSSALVGCIIGVSVSGFRSDSFGRKKVLMISALLYFFIFALLAFPTSLITWKLIPETKGKSLEEIEKHWLGYQK